VPYRGNFYDRTDAAVRKLQRIARLRPTGVVRRGTRKALARRMFVRGATWYGPGFYGRRTACGRVLRRDTIGVAHRRLPCGTPVTFAYRGRWVRAKVVDRGPYRRGYAWDLTRRTAKRLGTLYAGGAKVRAAVVK
jgi:rare lipoprotein A (peptidoglycan hydrolase)